MKWFKHDSDAKNDVRHKLLISKFGYEGYGIYWGILEFIADDIDEKKDSSTWGVLPEIFTTEFLAIEFHIDENKLKNMIDFMVEIGLFDREKWCENRIANFKILSRTDEYTDKLRKKQEPAPDKVPTKSRQCPDKVPTKSRARTEQSKSRSEENRIDNPPTPLNSETEEIIARLVEEFHAKYPQHLMQYSTGGVIKCHDEFEQRLKDGWKPDQIRAKIALDWGICPAPWDIFNKHPSEEESDFGPGKKYATQMDWINAMMH